MRYVPTLLMLVASFGCQAASCLSYDVEGTELSGNLLRLEFGVGEGAKRPAANVIWQLRRVEPFCVNGDDSTGNLQIQGASVVELSPTTDQEQLLAEFDGKAVTVVGRLIPTLVPHYHPELIMSISSIREQ